MGRRIKLKAFIRYDSNGQVVAGSMKVQATKPLNGDWVEVPMHKDTSVTYPHYKLRAFVRYDNKNNLIFGGPVVASTAPKNGNWGETAYYKSDISSITTTSTTTNPFIIDKSGENWYVVEIDSYFNILNLATYSSGGYTFIMPTGIPRSYYSSTAVTTLEGYGNIVTVDSTLISTDAILSWYASYTPTITYRTIDLSDYDARTSASDADKATIIANYNDLSVNDPAAAPRPITP
ncbi:MAG: hypothetical protein H5T96_09240 [Tissierellales bacterium]|nr:hypothetical protein [Tissierellales bacterium]